MLGERCNRGVGQLERLQVSPSSEKEQNLLSTASASPPHAKTFVRSESRRSLLHMKALATSTKMTLVRAVLLLVFSNSLGGPQKQSSTPAQPSCTSLAPLRPFNALRQHALLQTGSRCLPRRVLLRLLRACLHASIQRCMSSSRFGLKQLPWLTPSYFRRTERRNVQCELPRPTLFRRASADACTTHTELATSPKCGLRSSPPSFTLSPPPSPGLVSRVKPASRWMKLISFKSSRLVPNGTPAIPPHPQ
jgi:hypothetical protein